MRSVGATMETIKTTSTTTETAFYIQHESQWHSPVPYLFGGLAAMLGLIVFALIILACSYWKLHVGQRGEGDAEGGDNTDKWGGSGKELPVLDEKIVVIMAGDLQPTFLATPMSNKSTGGSGNGKSNENKEREEGEVVNDERRKEEVFDHDHQTATATMGNGEANH